jgi:hypothetical protein
LVLAAAFVVGTWVFGWTAVAWLAAAWALLSVLRDSRSPTPAGGASGAKPPSFPALESAAGAVLAWAVLIAIATARDSRWVIARGVADATGLGSWALAIIALAFAGLLAWSAARVTIGVIQLLPYFMRVPWEFPDRPKRSI